MSRGYSKVGECRSEIWSCNGGHIDICRDGFELPIPGGVWVPAGAFVQLSDTFAQLTIA